MSMLPSLPFLSGQKQPSSILNIINDDQQTPVTVMIILEAKLKSVILPYK